MLLQYNTHTEIHMKQPKTTLENHILKETLIKTLFDLINVPLTNSCLHFFEYC